MKSRLIPCICSAAMLLSGHVLASNLKWEVYGDLGAQYESNPRKAASGSEQGDTKVRALAGIRLHQETEFIFLDFDYRASHETWLGEMDEIFGDRNKLEGYGQFSWKPADYFTFYVNNRREDLIVNNRFVETQNNRTVRSVIEVGAEFTARLSRVDTLNLVPIYRAVNFSDAGIDSKRPGVLLFWGHRLSETDALSVNLFAESIDFETPVLDAIAPQDDILRAQAFVGYSARLNRLSYEFEAGYTWVRRDDSNNADSIDDSANDYSGPLIRARLNYQHENHSFQLRVIRDLTDTSVGLGGSFSGGDYGTGDTSVNQLALVTRSQIDVYYDLAFAAEQWSWQIGYRYDQQDVEYDALDALEDAIGPIDPPIDLGLLGVQDETRNLIYSALLYEMTPKITARLIGNYRITDFTDSPLGREDDIYRLGLVFTFRMFKYGYFDLGAEQENRNSNVVHDYVDNKIFANLRLVFPARPGRRDARGGYGGGGGGGDFGF